MNLFAPIKNYYEQSLEDLSGEYNCGPIEWANDKVARYRFWALIILRASVVYLVLTAFVQPSPILIVDAVLMYILYRVVRWHIRWVVRLQRLTFWDNPKLVTQDAHRFFYYVWLVVFIGLWLAILTESTAGI